MICPFCVEDVPDGTTRHNDCKRNKGKLFPPFYNEFHGKEGAQDPVIISVVGFPGHGKTVYLCALFHFLDQILAGIWPGFFTKVLDQASMDTLRTHRASLDKGELPPPTDQKVFPRPGIFQLKRMPQNLEWTSTMPRLEDTTILIYDPPGEAFYSDDKISELASFVKRSSCVLFLIDLKDMGKSAATEMATLLGTYILGREKIKVTKQSQHLIVVYTKSDVMKSYVPGFKSYLEKHPDLEKHLKEQMPETLRNPNEHQSHLNRMSNLLEDFTRNELKAYKFINQANDSFKSVSYTVVSSLGTSPQKDGTGIMRMTVEMSPRCVADPLLFVLAKSIPIEEEPIEEEPKSPRSNIAVMGGVIVFALLILFLVLWLNAEPRDSSTLPGPRNSSPTPPARTPRQTVSPPNTPFNLPRATSLLTEPADKGIVILNLPSNTKVSPLDSRTDGNGKIWIKISINNQKCLIGRASCTLSESCGPSVPVRIAEYAGWVSVLRVDRDTGDDETLLDLPDDPAQPATLSINAKLRDGVGMMSGTPVLILPRGTKVNLTGEEELIGDKCVMEEGRGERPRLLRLPPITQLERRKCVHCTYRFSGRMDRLGSVESIITLIPGCLVEIGP